MTYAQVVTASLLDKDKSTLASLTTAFNVSFMREKDGFGTGSCALQLSDPNAADVTRGRYIRVFVDGVTRFTFKIETTPRYTQVEVGEHVTQALVCTGRGWGCTFEEWIVDAENPDIPLDYAYRLFSFASFYFPNAGGWGNAQELYEYHDGVAAEIRVDSVLDTGADPEDPLDDVLTLYPAPIGFPWPLAPKNGPDGPLGEYAPTYWTIAAGAAEDDVGYHFFRGTFLLAGSQAVTFMVTADNLFTLYLQGVPILGEADDQMMWRGWKEVTMELPAGLYVVGAVVQNVDAPDIPYNPGGFLFDAVAIEVYPGDIETSLTLSLLASDAEWDTFFAEDEWPGWTPGQILIQLIDEAMDRGCIPTFDGVTFTDMADTDSNDWDSVDPETTIEFIPTESFRLGQNGGDVLRQLNDEGWIDWDFEMDNLELNAYAAGTMGTVTAVEFSRGVNITGLERGESAPYANALRVQYSGPAAWTWVENTSEITAYGARVEDVYSTTAATEDEAKRLGRVELRRRVQSGKVAVLLSILPTSSADAPFEGFQLGDYIDVPNEDEDGHDSLQVMSITCTQDPQGFAEWRLECAARWRTPPLEAVNLLRTIGGKSMGSASDHGVAKD